MSHKIFNNNLVAVCKSKFALKINKPAYIGICILVLVLMYEFHMTALKINMATNQNYYSQTLMV